MRFDLLLHLEDPTPSTSSSTQEVGSDVDDAFRERCARQLAQLVDQDVVGINAGSHPHDDRWRHLLQTQTPRLAMAAGLHPWWVTDDWAAVLPDVERALPSCCAVGETGLDPFAAASLDTQADAFAAQLDLADAHGLPVVAHVVRQHDAAFALLRQRPTVTGVVHGFSGSWVQAKRYLDVGWHLSVGPQVRQSRAKKMRDAAQRVPLDRLLLETDGHHVDGALLDDVAATVAQLRGCDADEVLERCSHNAAQLWPQLDARNPLLTAE